MSAKNRREAEEFQFIGGIAEFIKHLNKGKSVLHDKPIYFEGERDLPNGGAHDGSGAAVQRLLQRNGVQLRE